MPSFRVSTKSCKQAAGLLTLLLLISAQCLASLNIWLTRTDLGPFPAAKTTAIGDMNGDGRLDLVTASDDPAGTIQIRLNIGSTATSVSFGGPTTLSVGFPVSQIALVDLNGDGLLDIVVAHIGGVTVFMNATAPGATTFVANPATTLPTPPGARSVAAADLNGDGRADLLVGLDGLNGPSAMAFQNQTTLGASTVNFAPGTLLPVSRSVPSVVAVDVNGDGRPDFVMANGLGILVALNTSFPGGPPSFSSPVPFGTGTSSTPTSVAAGDLNGDGKPDFVVGQGNNFAVLINATSPGGGPSFAPAALTSAPMGVNDIGIGAFYGGATSDVVASNATGGGITTWRNLTPQGALALTIDMAVTSSGPQGFGIGVGDLNGDGRADVVVTEGNSSGIYVNGGAFIGIPSSLTFTNVPSLCQAGQLCPMSVAVQDALGNGVATTNGTVTISLAMNPGGALLSGTTTVNAQNGVASFGNLSLNKTGSGYTLSASSTGLAGATSGAFTVSPAAPSQLVITTQPSNEIAGMAISPAVTVTLLDAFGNTATQATNGVTIALGMNPGGATLSGTTTVNAVNGVATFSNLSLDKAGMGYTLTASSTGISGATSNPFNNTIPVCPTITLSPTTLPPGTVGSTLGGIVAGGGTEPYSYSITAGALPPGVSLGFTTGIFIGVATQAGTFTFTATATDRTPSPPGPCSHSQTYTLTVNPQDTATIVSSSLSPSIFGKSVTLTATVRGLANTLVTPTGTATFNIDGVTDAPVILDSSGRATFSISSLAVGTHTITVDYPGDAGSKASRGIFTLVNKANSMTVVTSPTIFSVYGHSVTFTATETGGDSPTGLITFVIDGTPASQIPLVNGTASFSTATLGAGTHTVSASYAGDSNFNASTSSAFTLTVNPTPATITANNLTKILNAPNPALTWTPSGLVNGDTAAVFTSNPTCNTQANTNSPVGSYPVTCSGAAAANYIFAYVAGTLKILYSTVIGHMILPPIDPAGTSVFNGGRTLPVKFQAFDANAVSIGTPGVVASFFLTAIINSTTTTVVQDVVDPNTPDAAFRFDPAAQQWILNLSTQNLAAGSTYVFTITLNDGSTIVFQFGLR